MAAFKSFLLTCLLLVVTFQGLHGDPAEERATREVLKKLKEGDYSAMLRPPGRGGTDVAIQVYIRDIDIDDVNMITSFDLTFRMLWNDTRLAYNAVPAFSRVQYVSLLDPSLLWLPDAFFKNAKVTQYESIHPEQYLRVYGDGSIVFSTRIKVENSCPMNLHRFPHDTQTCFIMIASYGYTTRDVLFKFAEADAISIGSEIHADRFRLEDYDTHTVTSITATGEYSSVQVSLKIRRYFGSYLIESYIPTMFLVMVAWFSFLIPSRQFLARILLTLIPMIALASFSAQYKKGLASVSYVSAIDIFNGISLCVIFLTLVYVIIVHVYESKQQDGEKSAASKEEGGGGGGGGDVDGEEGKEGKAADKDGGALRRFAHRHRHRADYISRVLLVGAYCFFLFVYFVAFCGTG